MEANLEAQVAKMVEPIDRMLDQLNVGSVFGEPAREGDLTIIPVAEMSTAFGYGYGFGQGPAGESQEAVPEGGGGGGGAMGKAKPSGYIQITPEGVSYVPAANPFLVPLAGIAVGAWMIFWIGMVLKAFARRGE